MSRTVYVNGEYVAEEDAKVSVFDRGFLFADGIYEVSSVLDGKLIDNPGHMARLERSLNELKMARPCSNDELLAIQKELIKRNDLTEGVVYMQVTRGAADRDFNFPKDATPSLVMFTQEKNILANPAADKGIAIVTLPDIRWQRRDIKTVQLLASSLAKQTAKDMGVDDAWLVEDGMITEGTSNNAFIVTEDGTIVTRGLSNSILHGITRKAVLKVANELGLTLVERSFTPEEAYDAVEAFSTSASSFVMPIIKIDDHILGNGVPGPVSQKLRAAYIAEAKANAE
ncbi:MAG TPA: D-amino acid aminotransferase [Rhodospirillaceae bacterium]|nr:D-amino acid aminotransferase [Rhodospirillaceae bacterium]|tara:strand:+ start:2035 stop:2889 length:855 start_codon:yes stop_codon:yes gene_type:complete